MAVRLLDKTPKGPIDWYTPVHRLWVVGKLAATPKAPGLIYISRGPVPSFILEGDNQSEVEKEAGRLINAFTIRNAHHEKD